jgi:hypothetical protein
MVYRELGAYGAVEAVERLAVPSGKNVEPGDPLAVLDTG